MKSKKKNEKKKEKKKKKKNTQGTVTGFHDSGQAIHPLCYEFYLWLVCAYNHLDEIKYLY